jgi:hypothetical protein
VIPAVEGEVLFPAAQAGEIDAAIFAAKAVAAEHDFEGHPAAGAEVFAEPVVQIHPAATGAAGEEKVAPFEGFRDKSRLAIVAAEMARETDEIQPLFPGTGSRDVKNTAATLRTACGHGLYRIVKM